MSHHLTKQIMLNALAALDGALPGPLTLIMGGGGAMILAHQYPLATTDIDAIPKGMTIGELDPYVKKIAADLNLPPDWLNPYFASFSYTLPSDYQARLVLVYQGNALTVEALGAEDMLILKCFAHRAKDVGHARQLLRNKIKIEIVEDQIHALLEQGVRGSQEALDFLEELVEDV